MPGMTVSTIDVGDVRLHRVSYAEVDLPPETFGYTADEVRAVEWADPVWANAGQVRAAAAAWIIESESARIVVDPALAADDLLRNDNDAALHQEAFAALLAGAGLPRESITHAVGTHIEGIGMFAWRNDDGAWAPFFPNARLMYSQRELDALDRGELFEDGRILKQLREQGAVTATADDEQLTKEVSLRFTGAHSPGHQVVRIDSNDEHATVLGHLAVVPLQLATGPCESLNMDPDAAWQRLVELRDEGTLLIGPLWPAPGAGRWVNDRLIGAR